MRQTSDTNGKGIASVEYFSVFFLLKRKFSSSGAQCLTTRITCDDRVARVVNFALQHCEKDSFGACMVYSLL